jgi:hypothetical protein
MDKDLEKGLKFLAVIIGAFLTADVFIRREKSYLAMIASAVR